MRDTHTVLILNNIIKFWTSLSHLLSFFEMHNEQDILYNYNFKWLCVHEKDLISILVI